MMSAISINLLDVSLFTENREHAAFRVLRDEAPVYFNPEEDGPGFFAVTRYADVSEILLSPERFSSAKGTQIKDRRAEGHGAASIHNSDPPYHTKLRDVALPGIRKNVMDSLRPKIRAAVADLIESCPRGETFDFVGKVAILLPMIVIGDLLGVPVADRDRMVHWANLMSDTFAGEEQHARARMELFEFFRRLVSIKRAMPADDLATVLAQATIDGELLSDEQLDAYFILLTVAGNETTRFLISGGLEQLCLQPDDLHLLRQSPDLVPAAVEEMVRWVSPVMQMRRTVTMETEIAGHGLKAGDKVVAYFVSANRDERRFPDPQNFSPTRKHNGHLGFGQGPHFCLGTHLARLEAQIFFEMLLERVSDIQLKGPGKRLPSYWFSGYLNLPIAWS
jgi:cytochrome P450